MHEKLFPGSRLKISYQTPPLVPFFSALFGFLLSPCVTHNSLFSLQNSINLNFFLSIICSSCEDLLLYNTHKICCKYLLHTWATRRSCFKSLFFGQKAKKCCRNAAAKSNWFDFAAVFLQHFLLRKLKILQCLMGGPRAASYVHTQRSTFLLRVDEKCCSWSLSFTGQIKFIILLMAVYALFLVIIKFIW